MKKSGFPLMLVLLCMIAVLGGGLWAAQTAGLIDIKQYLAHLPFLKQSEGNAPVSPSVPVVSPIEKENLDLRTALQDMEKKGLTWESEKTALLKQIEDMQQELVQLRAYKENKEKEVLNAQDLALYYREMKPEAVVQVMEKLDDSTIMLILPFLEKEQVGKILSLMDPQRAALLTQLLLEGQ